MADSFNADPQGAAFRVLFEDTHLIVLSKAAGLLSQGEVTGDTNLVDLLRVRWGRNYVGLIHRLDRNTSGLMVVAKRTKSAQRLSDSLYKDQLYRTYWAILEGLTPDEFRWEHALVKDERQNRVVAHTLSRAPRGAKRSALRGHTLAQSKKGYSIVEFVLETGRSHQIRAQSAAMEHPLVGDRKYGAAFEFSRPALHSASLSFHHPMSKEFLTFSDPPPTDLQSLEKKLGF